MILASVFATTALISLARGSPMSYVTYRRREQVPAQDEQRPELLPLYDDQRGLENTDPPLRSPTSNDIERDYGFQLSLPNDIPDVGVPVGSRGNSAATRLQLARAKKLGLSRNSLSIVNPVDVLRQRVLLELARRKAMQDQRQVDANRRILETIGKRSIHDLDVPPPGYPRILANPRTSSSSSAQESHEETQRIPIIDRTREWYNNAGRGGDSAVPRDDRENGDADTI